MSTRFTQGGAGAVTASTLTAGVVEIATNAEAQAGVSTDKVITPYQLATYSGSVTGALVYRGAYDASTSLPDISNASKGDFYVISADGSIDGVAVKIGDHIVFKQDAGGTLNSGDFDVVDNSESTDILRDADIGTDIQAHATVLDSLSGLALNPGDLIKATAASTLTAVPSTDFQLSSSTLTDLGSLTTPAVDSVVQFTSAGTLNLIDQSTLGGANALDDLSDVSAGSPSIGDVLYRTGPATWANVPLNAGNVAGLGTAAALDYGSNAGNVVIYDINGDLPSIDALSDVALTNPADGHILVSDASGNFANEAPSAARTSLGLAIGTDVQAHDATLDALSALALSSGDLIKATGANTLTAVPSTDFQLSSSTLTDLGSLTTPGADSVVQFTSAGAINLIDQSTLGGANALDDLTDVSAGSPSIGDVLYRTGPATWANVPLNAGNVAGLGTAAVLDYGSNAGNVVIYDINGDLPSIDALSDVALTNPAAGHILVSDASGNFANEAPSAARTSLGLAIGTDVQAHDATLDALSALALSSGDLIKATGANTLTAVPSTDFQLSSSTLTDLGSLTTPGADSVVQFTSAGAINLIAQSTLGGSTTGALVYQGSATVNGATTPPAEITGASKGDFFVVSGEGYYTGATSKFLRDGDHIVFNQDVGGSLTAAKFDVIDNTGLFDKVDQYSGTALSLQPRRVYTYNSIPNGATTFTLPDSSSLVSGDMIKLAWANTSQNSQHELSVTFAGGLGKPGLEHRAYGTSTTFNANTAGVTAVIKTRGQSITLIYDDVLDKFMVEMGTRFLGQLLDLDLDTSVPVSGEFLKYDGTSWISEQIASGDVSGLGTAATSAATDFLAVANNLSDLGDAATARTNLSLGTAATSAATDFLAVANNLSDLGDAATARTNLNLGTAATAAATDFLSGTGADTLGGDLDVGSSSIVSSANADIALSPNGTGQILLDGDGTTANGGVSIENGLVDIKNAGSVSQLKLYCESSNAHAVTLQSAAHASYTGGSYSLTLPGALPGSVQYLKTDTSGNLSWDTPAGGGGSRPALYNVNASTTIGSTNPIGASELERIYIVDSSSAVTMTLPQITGNVGDGYKLNIKRDGGNNVTITANAADDIEGGSAGGSVTLAVDKASFTLVADTTNTRWHII